MFRTDKFQVCFDLSNKLAPKRNSGWYRIYHVGPGRIQTVFFSMLFPFYIFIFFPCGGTSMLTKSGGFNYIDFSWRRGKQCIKEFKVCMKIFIPIQQADMLKSKGSERTELAVSWLSESRKGNYPEL